MFRLPSTLVLFLLLALPGVALAQATGTLAGRVIDAQSREGLPGANVRIEGTTLGAATDLDGNYRIIGVPVGAYTITASFAGYPPQSFENVEINAGLTRTLNFSLSTRTLDDVVVVYERPIIQPDAIGVPRVISGADLQNLPIRGVNAVTATQSGVVANDGSDGLFVRGGREQEIAYFVDGVRVTGLLGVNQQAIQEQEILIGTIPARFGDVQSGVVSITTRTGRQDFFGAAEAVTSRGLDAFGYNLLSLSLGGPVVPGRIGFFLSGEGNLTDDANPYARDTYRLSPEALEQLRGAPQSMEFRNAAGERTFVPIPVALFEGAPTFEQLVARMRQQGLVPAGFNTVTESRQLIPTADTYTAENFILARGKDDPLRQLTLNGSLNFDFTRALSLRLGGGLETRRRNTYSFTNSLYNPENRNQTDQESYRLYGTFRQRISDAAFYQLQASYQDSRFWVFPEQFSRDLSQTIEYGNRDNEYNALAARYYAPTQQAGDTAPRYRPQFASDGGAGLIGRVAANTFLLPGFRNFTYQKGRDERFGFTGSATTQIGVNQIEFGGEYEQRTSRRFTLAARTLADFARRNNIASYDQLPEQAFRNLARGRYGYDFRGINETNTQDIDRFFADGASGADLDLAPYRPIYFGGYVQNKIEFSDLVIQVGFRVDGFDQNTQVLRDIYAPLPVIRAGSLANRPAGIGEDFAVYFDDNGNGNRIVGFRDLRGNFYDAQGSRSTQQAITESQLAGGMRVDGSQPRSAAYTDYETQFTLMPRLGVSFPVTDRALFFASYNVTGQRPTEQAYGGLELFREIGAQDSRTPNPGLRPEKTTQYELGFRQRVGERAALTLSGFYRTQENKISNFRLDGGLEAYGTYVNRDFTTNRGVEVGFDLRRTQNLALNANYTLSFAQGTGSDAGATATAVWRGDFFPNFISPADFDQRHTANFSVDYRFGAGEGPVVNGLPILENFGLNVLGQFASGTRYTPVDASRQVTDSFTGDATGFINSATLPSSARIDLRLDRAFDLGVARSRMRTYLTVQNLFDTRNVLAVYRATGLPDEDGYLGSPAGQALLAGARAPAAYAFNYTAFVQSPINIGGSQSSDGALFYGLPRRIRLGVLLDF